jgi:hypothetical protein
MCSMTVLFLVAKATRVSKMRASTSARIGFRCGRRARKFSRPQVECFAGRRGGKRKSLPG